MDKLVDQIGSGEQPEFTLSKQQDTRKLPIFEDLSEFNETCLTEISKIDNILDINILSEISFIQHL